MSDQWRAKKSFAVVSCWPKVRNAEYEVIQRVQLAADAIGYTCLVVDNSGHALDGSGHMDGRVDFCLSLHFFTAKVWNTYTYHTVWNPVKYYHDWSYPSSRRNLLSCDEYISYESKPLCSHLQNMIGPKRRHQLEHCVSFVAGCAGPLLRPSVDFNSGFHVFYCGINWERGTSRHGRHHRLFQILDREGIVRFYGPRRFCGYRPWAGFRNYAGEIPFDGVTLLNKINECGVALVLSSDEHRRFHCVSSRLYESIAAGALVISDNNQFVVEHFGSCVRIFEYTDDHAANFEAIMAQIRWVMENPAEAKAMVLKAQEIYRAKFSMEVQLQRLVAAHAANIPKTPSSSRTVSFHAFARTSEELEHVVHGLVPDVASVAIQAKICVICDSTLDTGPLHEACSVAGCAVTVERFSDAYGMWSAFARLVHEDTSEYTSVIGAGERIVADNFLKVLVEGEGCEVIASCTGWISDAADAAGFKAVKLSSAIADHETDRADQERLPLTGGYIISTSFLKQEFDVDALSNIAGYFLNALIFVVRHRDVGLHISPRVTFTRPYPIDEIDEHTLEDTYGYGGYFDYASHRYPLVKLHPNVTNKMTIINAVIDFLKINYPRQLPRVRKAYRMLGNVTRKVLFRR